MTRPPPPLRALLVACLATGLLAACGTPGRNVPVELPTAPRPLASRLVVAGLLVAITAALIWNEFTRSGGLWEHG